MNRRDMPSRRDLVRHKVTINGQKIYFDVGFRDAAHTEVGEVFIVVEQTGAEMRSLIDELARLASKLLQYGCPLEEFALSWLGLKGSPCGPVQGDDDIKFASSLRDYVARSLLIRYCGRTDLSCRKDIT